MLHKVDSLVERYLLHASSLASFDDDCACPEPAQQGFFSTAALDIDCACPEGALHLSGAALSPARYVQAGGCLEQGLPGAHTLVFSPVAPLGPAVLSEAGVTRWRAFSQPQAVQDDFDRQLAQQGLLQPCGETSSFAASPPQTLTAWLHVTNACNLDCPFCYVRKSSDSMSEAVGLATLEGLVHSARQGGFRALKLKYAGGEATLHFEMIQSLHRQAQRLCKQAGLALQAVVLSNGAPLTPAQVDWMLAQDVRMMISLDGVGDAHDRQRPSLDGGSAFDALQHGVDDLLLPRGLRPQICVTVTGCNADDAAAAVRWALARRLAVSLNFYRQSAGAAADLALDEQRIIAGMRAAYAVFEEYLPEQPFLGGLLDRFQPQAHLQTCGVGRSYVVVDHQGRVGQCQMQLHHAQALGDDADWLAHTAAGPIHNLAVDAKTGCRTCAFRYRCTGGCPLETFHAYGRFDSPSPNCRIYKALYPEALRLEGLRLLKEHHLRIS